MRITVIGAGYVGLVTGTCLAARGHEVMLVERSPERRAPLERGAVPIVEPGLQELYGEHRGRIEVRERVPQDGPRDLTFITVGTPIDDGESDLSQLRGAVADLAAWPDAHVSVRSTLPPGLSQRLPEMLNRPDGSRVSTNPEFLRQGSAVEDFLNPSRVVFGRYAETTDEHLALVDEAYGGLPGERLYVDVTAAELIKNVSNAFLALKLSFVNEVASLADEYDSDVEDVLHGIGLDPRIGTAYMRPGLGFGGSCLPKELEVLSLAGRKRGLPMHVARAASQVNAEQQDRFARMVIDALPDRGGRIGLLGLSFKAGTDDLRGSPALTVARRLLDAGHTVVAHDPAADPARVTAALPDLQLADAAEDVFAGAHAIVIATEWPAFRDLDYARLRSRMAGRMLFDGRNLLDVAALRRAGFDYRAVGRRGARPVTPGTRKVPAAAR